MKLIHLSDLHLGKRLNEYSLLDDQQYILQQILRIIRDEAPDAVLIAGDVYDKPLPSAEAVHLLDDFLSDLYALDLPVLLISGNHDSADRLPFAGRILKNSKIYIAPTYHGSVECIDLWDEYGPVHCYLLPFVKPVQVRAAHPDRDIQSYHDAVRTAIEDMNIDPAQRNILITHQFISGAERSDSEELSVGGTDQVDLSVLQDFQYVALGHLHRPQTLGEDGRVRYCGSPLKYSFSEASGEKSVTVVTMDASGSIQIDLRPLRPMREMRELRGSYTELTARSFYENTTYREDYVHLTLTDEEDVPDALGRLRSIYHHIMKLDYDNIRTRFTASQLPDIQKTLSPLELFSQFYEAQNKTGMSEEQEQLVSDLIKSIWEVDA